MRAANGTIIRVLGYFSAPLLSKYDLFHLGYLKLDPDGAFASKRVYSSDADSDFSTDVFKDLIDKLHQKYKKVSIGVGKYNHYTVHLEVRPGSQPFVQRAINTLPYPST